MLRLFVLLLIFVNATYFAWSQGMLRVYGFAPTEQREPQRVQQQIRPDAVKVLSIEEARRLEQAAQTPPKPPECLMAGPFDEAQTEILRKALESTLPSGAWVLDTMTEPARWIVYMGKFSSKSAMEKKRSELLTLKVQAELSQEPDLLPGLSLGQFESRAQAEAGLKELRRKGVRSARVVKEKPESHQSQLRIPAADEGLKVRAEGLKPVLGDKTLHGCVK